MPTPDLTRLDLAAGQRWQAHLPAGTWIACRHGRVDLIEATLVQDATGLSAPVRRIAAGDGHLVTRSGWVSVDAAQASRAELLPAASASPGAALRPGALRLLAGIARLLRSAWGLARRARA